MRRLAPVFVVILFCSFCGTEHSKVDTIIEDGVEVVLNHLEPYEVKGEPSNLVLEEELRVDFEDEKFADLGMRDILGFDVDSNGFVYLWSVETSENFIYRFDKDGNFVGSFGRKGQGPGELEQPMNLRVNDSDEVVVSDEYSGKIVHYDSEGKLLREVRLEERIVVATQLGNENLLVIKGNFNPETGYTQLPVFLFFAESDEVMELQQGQKMPNWVRASEINGFDTVRKLRNWSISESQIFVDNLEGGYEFLVYDFDGQLLRKIRKEYEPVGTPQELKDSVHSELDREELRQFKVIDKLFFPEHMPPFQYYFADDDSRLYVMTCEQDQGKNEYFYDVFNPDGYFIGRISLDNFGNAIISARPLPLPAVAKYNKLYYLREKESGYYELVIKKMIWQ